MYEVYDRKVDKQRRIALPPEWDYDEVMVFEDEEKKELKVVPKNKKALVELFDSVPAPFLSFPYEDFKKKAYRKFYKNR